MKPAIGIVIMVISIVLFLLQLQINTLEEEINRLDKINVLLLERADVYHKIDSVQHIVVMQHLEKLQEESGK